MQTQSDRNSIKVFIWAHTKGAFNSCASRLTTGPAVWINSNHLNRAEALAEYLSECQNSELSLGPKAILFLDADCEISGLKKTLQHFKTLIEFRQAHPILNSNFVLCGQYQNPEQATRLQRAHNFIANSWLKLKFANLNPVLLGGAIFICANHESKILLSSTCPVKWGAEDAWLAEVFKDNQFELIQDSRFKVIHHTSKNLGHYLRRAFLHGKNQSTSRASQALPIEEVITYLSSAREFYPLMPEILLHFAVSKLGALTRRFRRKHKWPAQLQNQKALV